MLTNNYPTANYELAAMGWHECIYILKKRANRENVLVGNRVIVLAYSREGAKKKRNCYVAHSTVFILIYIL